MLLPVWKDEHIINKEILVGAFFMVNIQSSLIVGFSWPLMFTKFLEEGMEREQKQETDQPPLIERKD